MFSFFNIYPPLAIIISQYGNGEMNTETVIEIHFNTGKENKIRSKQIFKTRSYLQAPDSFHNRIKKRAMTSQ